jgi:hypothetical protein
MFHSFGFLMCSEFLVSLCTLWRMVTFLAPNRYVRLQRLPFKCDCRADNILKRVG